MYKPGAYSMRNFFFLLLMGLLVASCGGQSNEVLPTLAVTPVTIQEVTATTAPTEAATQPPAQRATLPPTWTPSPAPSQTSVPPTNTAIPTSAPIATLAACATFTIDRDRSPGTFVVGQPVQVYWLPVQEASRYRIVIQDEFETEIFAGYAVDATYTFEPDQFEAGKRYIWQVYPEDVLRQQMCIAISGELWPG
jgi:hypothetical protein